MVPQVDFDIADSILRVLEGWEAGNSGLYRKHQAYKKSQKIQNFILAPGVQKNDILGFDRVYGFIDIDIGYNIDLDLSVFSRGTLNKIYTLNARKKKHN